MGLRIYDRASTTAAYIWNNFLADDWKSVGENVTWAWDQLQSKQPDEDAPRTYPLANGTTITLPNLSNAHEIAYQTAILQETRNWGKRVVKVLATTGGAIIFLCNPSLSGAFGAVALPYVCAKAANKCVDKWYEKTEKSNNDRLAKAVNALIQQGAAAAAAHAGPRA